MASNQKGRDIWWATKKLRQFCCLPSTPASATTACDEDDCLSTAALRAVNNLPDLYRAYEEFNRTIKPGFPRLRLSKRKEKSMKLTTIALALAFTLPATFALAQAPMNLPGTQYRTTGVMVSLPGTELPTTGVTVGQTGHIATRPMNISGNTLGPIAVAADPSGSTLTPIAVATDPSGSTLTPSALMPGRTTGVTVGQTGPIAIRPMNISGNTLGPIAVAADPSGSTLTPSALMRGR